MVVYPIEDSKSIHLTSHVSIDSLMESVLARFQTEIQSKRLCIEKEIAPILAKVAPELMDSAFSQLIETAIAGSPEGGELNITLFAGDQAWEIEVSGNGQLDLKENDTQNRAVSGQKATDLTEAKKAAIEYGG
ncbi:MAG: hypothetical protein AAGA30_16640, partial [Planctomycetota bacterium]